MNKKVQIILLSFLSTSLAFCGPMVLLGPLEATDNAAFVLFNVTVVAFLISFVGARCAVNQITSIYGKLFMMFMVSFAGSSLFLLVKSFDMTRRMLL